MATRVLLSLSIVIVLILFSLDIENVCSSAEKVEWYPPPICNWTANYTRDSKFVSNVNTALSSLRVDNIEDASQSRFRISEYGQSPNQIYALLQCRGDATVDQCYNCSQQAKIAVLQDCANYVGSRVWSKFCFLRYNGNYNFTGQLDTNGDNETNQHFFHNIDTIDSGPYAFVTAARQLLSSLASDITSGSSRNRYASNTTVDNSFHRIHALAQCWADISLGDCNTCLSSTIDKLFQANDTASGARGLTGNCIVQYDLKSFFNDPPPPPPPPPQRPQKSPPPQRPQQSSSSIIPIISGVLSGMVILLLMVGLFATRKRLKSAIFGRHTELDPNKRRRLDWEERYNIIVGVTCGLLCLHEDSHLRIIHRDIKPSNILLDEKLNPKIADFGLAKIFVEDETHVTTKAAGTRGYMAPEYAMQGQLSVKADVYSFGILVLELMSGRKCVDFNLSPEMDFLLEWAWRLYKRGYLKDIIDPAITETCSDQEQALRCIHVGFLCTQAEASLRPSMSTINLMISTKLMILPDPIKPAFVKLACFCISITLLVLSFV